MFDVFVGNIIRLLGTRSQCAIPVFGQSLKGRCLVDTSKIGRQQQYLLYALPDASRLSLASVSRLGTSRHIGLHQSPQVWFERWIVWQRRIQILISSVRRHCAAESAALQERTLSYDRVGLCSS